MFLVISTHTYRTADVKTKSNNGWTPINIASLKDHLDIVKYAYETCHAEITEKKN